MAELFLVRHGQASFGAADYDQLSEVGYEQSERLGEYFNQRNIEFDFAVTGNMKRHHQTADSILKHAVLNGDRVENKGWNEFDFESVIKAYLLLNPSEQPAKDAPRSVYYKILKSAMRDWSNGVLEKGLPESWSQFTGRVEQATLQVQNTSAKKVLVATSGGAIAIKLMLLLGVSPQQAIDFNLQIKNTAVQHFYFSKSGFQLSSFNTINHLDTPQAQHLITYS